jgi:predicted PurR-regulated permease PerM
VFLGVGRFFDVAREFADSSPIPDGLKAALAGLADQATWGEPARFALSFLRQGLQGLLGTLSLLGILFLLPVYLFYVMLDLQRMWEWVKAHLPEHDRDHTLRVLASLDAGMTAFLRGRVILSLLKGLVLALGLALCGTPLALVVGLGAGILSILPFLGPVIGFALAMALTLAEGIGVWGIIGVCAVFAVAEVLENVVLMPLAMGKGADLHPLLLLFSVIFWGAALGMFGALVAVPLTLLIKVLLEQYVMPSVRELAGAAPPD